MPGRQLLGRIVEEYHLDPKESLRLFTEGTPTEFGAYLREEVFKGAEDEAVDSDQTGVSTHDTDTGSTAA